MSLLLESCRLYNHRQFDCMFVRVNNKWRHNNIFKEKKNPVLGNNLTNITYNIDLLNMLNFISGYKQHKHLWLIHVLMCVQYQIIQCIEGQDELAYIFLDIPSIAVSEIFFQLQCKVSSPNFFFHSFIHFKISASARHARCSRFSDALPAGVLSS